MNPTRSFCILMLAVVSIACGGGGGGGGGRSDSLGSKFVDRLEECNTLPQYIATYGVEFRTGEELEEHIDDNPDAVSDCITQCAIDQESCSAFKAVLYDNYDCELQCGQALLTLVIGENCSSVCTDIELSLDGYILEGDIEPGQSSTISVEPGQYQVTAESKEGCEWDFVVTVPMSGLEWYLNCDQ